MIELNYTLIAVATVVQFVLGAVWYSVIFGKPWMEIMGMSGMSKEELAKHEKSMVPFYALQFVLTAVTTWVLASNIQMFEIIGTAGTSVYWLAFFMWVGYIVPVQISSIIWGNTKKKYWAKQTAIMCGMQFVGIMLAAFILSM
jgi:hypothetical protein